jgi:hypothetical protein
LLPGITTFSGQLRLKSGVRPLDSTAQLSHPPYLET